MKTKEQKETLLNELQSKLQNGVFCKINGIDEPKKLTNIDVDEINGTLLDFGYNEDSLLIQVYLSEVEYIL